RGAAPPPPPPAPPRRGEAGGGGGGGGAPPPHRGAGPPGGPAPPSRGVSPPATTLPAAAYGPRGVGGPSWTSRRGIPASNRVQAPRSTPCCADARTASRTAYGTIRASASSPFRSRTRRRPERHEHREVPTQEPPAGQGDAAAVGRTGGAPARLVVGAMSLMTGRRYCCGTAATPT